MKVIGCDPFLSDAAKAKLSPEIKIVATRDEVYKNSDFISVHTPLIDDPDPDKNTKKMINAEKIALMKDGVIVLNLARDLLVDDAAMAAALESGKVRKYVSDFPNAASANMKGCIAIPHLGASTEEAEDNCAVMAVEQVRNYLENGNIINSVNFPRIDLGEKEGTRLAVIFEAEKVDDIEGAVKAAGVAVTTTCLGVRGKVGYFLADLSGSADAAAVEAIAGVKSARVF